MILKRKQQHLKITITPFNYVLLFIYFREKRRRLKGIKISNKYLINFEAAKLLNFITSNS